MWFVEIVDWYSDTVVYTLHYMNLFKSTTLTWWQLGLLKWAVLCIGIAIGAHWSTMFVPYAVAFVAVGLALSCYLGLMWVKNK